MQDQPRKTPPRRVIEKLLWPALTSLGVLAFFYFGEGDQAFGLAAMDSTRKALKYVLGVAAFLSLAVLVHRIVNYVIFDGLVVKATGVPVPKLLTQLSGLVIYLIALTACAGIIFNQDLTVFWAASGVAGLVLGMALKELLQDVFAGIALNIDRAVRIGDYLQLHRSGDNVITGQLLEISWRTTQIKDVSGDVIVLPNSKFSAYTITNFSQPSAGGIRTFMVTLDAAIPQARATRILQAAALEAILDFSDADVPAPTVRIDELRLEGIRYVITIESEWRHVAQLRALVYQHVLEHLAHAGIEPARNGPPAAKVLGLPDTPRLMALIGQSVLFGRLAEEDLRHLADGARLRVELPGRTIVQAGEAATNIYLVLEGLLVATTAARRDGGRPLPPPLLRPGHLFDASAFLLGEAHLSTVRTRTSVLLCEIDYALLSRLFRSSSDALRRIAQQLAAQYEQQPFGQTGVDRGEDILRQMRHMFPEASVPPVSIAAC